MKQYLRKEEIRPETKRTKRLDVIFFPEGGHLVIGMENRIAFKAIDEEGKGVNIEELTIEGNPIAVSPQHLGMGYFIYLPREKKAKASILYKGKTHSFALPQAEPYGYAIKANHEADDTLRIAISTSFPDTTKLLGMTLMHAGKVAYVDTLTMHKTTQSKAIATSELPTGTYQFTLFDAEGTIWATRMLFINNGMKQSPITIRQNKAHYKPFEKVKMRIETTNKEKQHLSLAVRDAADYGTGYDDDIRTYMLLSSELKGYIEHPRYYFETDDEEHRSALDLLMMVQGWSRYSLERMQQPISPVDVHYTEESLVLEGHALHPRKDEPMQGVEVRIKLHSPDRQLVQDIKATSDEHGYWGVNLQDFEGEWDLNIQTYKDDKPIVARLRLERSSAPEVLAYPLAALPLQHRMDTSDIAIGESVKEIQKLPESSILLDNVEVEGRRRYVDFCTFQAYNVEKDKELIIDKGEYTNMVADYLSSKGYTITHWGAGSDSLSYLTQCTINGYRTLWHVLSGTRKLTRTSYTPGYEIDIQNVKSVMIYDSPHSYMGNPCVYDVLSPSEIEGVQKPNLSFPSGLYVVEIHLYPKLQSPISWFKNTRQTTFEGYSSKIEYYTPQYPNGPIQGDADYRRTLYWNPEVKVSNGRAEVEFYNNSYTKSLHISAEGITSNGEFIVYDSDKPTN